MKKFIIGRMTCRPEMRAEFLDLSRRHQIATRAEPGCEFFDISLCLNEPNVAIVTECFVDEAAHQTHNAAPHMAAFQASVAKVLKDGRFHNIYSDTIRVDDVHFD